MKEEQITKKSIVNKGSIKYKTIKTQRTKGHVVDAVKGCTCEDQPSGAIAISAKNKMVKAQRTRRYFVDAAKEIIEEDSLSGVTIRSVAERAGYNSATLYNYFENMDQLLAFTCIDLITVWLVDVYRIKIGEGDSVDKYIMGWKIFCDYSFQDPTGYSYIYSSLNSNEVIKYFKEYFEIFPDSKQGMSDDFIDLYTQNTLAEQEKQVIKPCIEEGYFSQEDAESIYTLALILYNGLLKLVEQDKNKTSYATYTKMFMKYFAEFIQRKLKKDKDMSQFMNGI